MSLVLLGDNDLLRDILRRLGLPTAHLRSALVSRCWLRSSDPAFLCTFRARHLPTLLNTNLSTVGAPLPLFLLTRTVPRR